MLLLARLDERDGPTSWELLEAGDPGAWFALNIVISILTTPAWLCLVWIVWNRYSKAFPRSSKK
jgi:hypothetical protein